MTCPVSIARAKGWPVEEIGGAILINGDMREVLPAINPRADLVLSDPPYPLVSGGAGEGGPRGGALSSERYKNTGELFEMVPWGEMAPVMFDALAASGDVVVMSNDRQLFPCGAAMAAAGFRFHRVLVWHKRTVTPNRWYMPDCEFAWYGYKGRARVITRPGDKALAVMPQRDVFHQFLGPDEAPHPTEKPVALMEHWLTNSTDAGALVVDPFLGSGSVAVAAVRSGRRVIGIELEPVYFRGAVKRVRAAVDRRNWSYDESPASERQEVLL